MQHLGVLEKAGLIFTKKEGRFRWNYIDVVPIRNIYDRLDQQIRIPIGRGIKSFERRFNRY